MANLNLFVAYSTLLTLVLVFKGAFGQPHPVIPGVNSRVYDLVLVAGLIALAWVWKTRGFVPDDPSQPAKVKRGLTLVGFGNLLFWGSAIGFYLMVSGNPAAGAALWFLPVLLVPAVGSICIGAILIEKGR